MSDRMRQWLVTAGAIFMIFGTLYGFGLIGTPVEQSSGGSLSAEATLLAPAVRAFSIWSVIYLGLIGYVIWQWLPANTASPRARRIGWLSALSMALNGLWLLVVQAGALTSVRPQHQGVMVFDRRRGPGEHRAKQVELTVVGEVESAC